MILDKNTFEWCTERGHPFVTYNPWLNCSYCRCGERQEHGERAMNWEAKWLVFHNHRPAEPCPCYTSVGQGER